MLPSHLLRECTCKCAGGGNVCAEHRPWVQDFVANLSDHGQRWVPIIDPPIHIKPGYAPFDTGIKQDVFVKDVAGNPYVGQVSR